MMHIGSGQRNEWEFEYTAAKLAEGATLRFVRSAIAKAEPAT